MAEQSPDPEYLAHKGLKATANGMSRWLDRFCHASDASMTLDHRWAWCRLWALQSRAAGGEDAAHLGTLFRAAFHYSPALTAEQRDFVSVTIEPLWHKTTFAAKRTGELHPTLGQSKAALRIVGGNMWTDSQWALRPSFSSVEAADMVVSAAKALSKITCATVRDEAYRVAVIETGMLDGNPAAALAGMEAAKAARTNWMLHRRISKPEGAVDPEAAARLAKPSSTAALRRAARGIPAMHAPLQQTIADVKHCLLAAGHDTTKLRLSEALVSSDNHFSFMKLWPSQALQAYRIELDTADGDLTERQKFQNITNGRVEAIENKRLVPPDKLCEMAVRAFFKRPQANNADDSVRVNRRLFCSFMWEKHQHAMQDDTDWLHYEDWTQRAKGFMEQCRAQSFQGRQAISNAGGGDCFFHALKHAMPSLPEHDIIRKNVCDWMQSHMNSLTGAVHDHIKFEALCDKGEILQRGEKPYVERMRSTGVYAGIPELHAAAEVLQRPIVVVNKSTLSLYALEYPSIAAAPGENSVVVLAFSGHVRRGHFEYYPAASV